MFASIWQRVRSNNWLRLALALIVLSDLFTLRKFSINGLEITLPNKLQDLATLGTSVIVEALPFVLLGVLLSIIVQVWLPDHFIVNRLPKQPLLRRCCISLLGVFLPVCECGNLPLARGLIVQGFTVAESITFLLAAPILNPITIITTQQAFRTDDHILIARVIGGFFIANLVGWLFSRHAHPERILTPKFAALCKQKERHVHTNRLDESVELFKNETSNILPALFIGAFLAALTQVVVPRSVLFDLGTNPTWSVVAMMLLAFIVSICSNVDAFFALAFSSTFTAGSIVSFLVFGPLIDIKMLNLMRTTYRTKTLVQLTALVALSAAAIGLAVNYAF
jgi:uncharacterized protein